MKKESAFKRAASTKEGRGYLYGLIASMLGCLVVSLISKGGKLMYGALLLSFVGFACCNSFIKIMNYFISEDQQEENKPFL